MSRGLPKGVQRRHSRRCPAFADRTARCASKGCTFQVQTGPRGARVTKTCATLDEARAWLKDHAAASRVDGVGIPTLEVAAGSWIADARAGVALARGGKRYKPGTLADYERSLRADLLPTYGHVRLDRLGGQLDTIVEDLQRRGLAASSVRNAVMPLRAIYRHAVRKKWIVVNPTLGLEVPTGSGRRMKVVPAEQVPVYLDALPVEDRPLWATAVYAGLRRGELMALRWADVDVGGGTIRVDGEAGNYDQRTRTTQAPKSAAGTRRVPIAGALREHLVAHRERAGARPTGLVFARGSLAGSCRKGTERLPFNDSSTWQRASKAFTAVPLPLMSLHDFRHTFASLAIAAMAESGVFNPKLLQAIMGHSSIQVTYDRYGHLFPGHEAEFGRMLDGFLDAAPALPEVAQAWAGLRTAVAGEAPEAALPVVTEALGWLGTWHETALRDGLLPSGVADVRTSAALDRIVQRNQEVREP